MQVAGLGEARARSGDVVTNYLGWWNDNGAFYYYHTLPGTNYEVSVSSSSCSASRLVLQKVASKGSLSRRRPVLVPPSG